MGRHTRSTLPLSEKLLQPAIADPPTVSSEINHRKIASKAHYNKHSQAPLKPLPLGFYVYTKPWPSQQGNPWIYGQIINPLLLQHQYGQFRTLPQPGPIASSHSTWIHFHTTSEPSTDSALDTGTSRKPTHTTTASSNASDWTAHHPLNRSNRTSRPEKLQQSMIINKWRDLQGNTPATKVQGLCCLLGGECQDKSRPLFANSIFFSFFVVFFTFSFIFFWGMSHYVTLLLLRYSPLIVPWFSIPGWTCLVVCAIKI